MMAIGLKGKSIGNTLQACLDAVIDERVPNDHASLLALAQEQMLADTDQMLSDFANDYRLLALILRRSWGIEFEKDYLTKTIRAMIRACMG